MNKRSKIPQVRQHVRDRSTLDHLTSGFSKPDMAPRGKKDHREFTEENGRKLDKAIHKEWTPGQRRVAGFLRSSC